MNEIDHELAQFVKAGGRVIIVPPVPPAPPAPPPMSEGERRAFEAGFGSALREMAARAVGAAPRNSDTYWPEYKPPVGMVTVPAQMIDDLIREVMIIAASKNPAPPPYPLDPLKPLEWGYTSSQHKAIVESCEQVVAKHNLRQWQVSTAQESPKQPTK